MFPTFYFHRSYRHKSTLTIWLSSDSIPMHTLLRTHCSSLYGMDCIGVKKLFEQTSLHSIFNSASNNTTKHNKAVTMNKLSSI